MLFMRVLIQRVSRASVTVDGQLTGSIQEGMVALVGFREGDSAQEIEWMAHKLPELRIFGDAEGKMNRSLDDVDGHILVISQFTLYGDCRKGNRPSFMAAARPETAMTLYDKFLALLRAELGAERVATGVFQAHMQLELVNDGPVTLLMEREHQSEPTLGLDAEN